MTVGEKIKTFRNIRGISQNMLGQLAGIDGTTIRKYELGSRNPKPDQLLNCKRFRRKYQCFYGF